MDFMGDFFGTNPATPEEREAHIKDSLQKTEVKHVIKDGEVYLNVSEVTAAFNQVSKLLTLKGLLTGDDISFGAAKGMSVASGILDKISGEFLRREADAILKASED